jgi:PAS domain-containing protein
MTGQGALAEGTTEEGIGEIAEEDLSDFFDNGIVALHYVGADGRILKANKAELDLLGYPESEYIGRPITDFTQTALPSTISCRDLPPAKRSTNILRDCAQPTVPSSMS